MLRVDEDSPTQCYTGCADKGACGELHSTDSETTRHRCHRQRLPPGQLPRLELCEPGSYTRRFSERPLSKYRPEQLGSEY